MRMILETDLVCQVVSHTQKIAPESLEWAIEKLIDELPVISLLVQSMCFQHRLFCTIDSIPTIQRNVAFSTSVSVI